MNPRTTGVIFLVAALLGAFVWFYEIAGEEGRKEAEALEKRLFPGVEAEDVEWVELRTRDGSRVRAERGDDGWTITRPLVFPGDGFALDAIASALAEITSEAAYEEPQAPEVYGLDSEERDVRFSAGGEERALRRGDAAPMGGNSYVQVVGSDVVYTVPTFRVTSFDKDFDDLREKRVLRFDPDAVTRVSASWPEGMARLERDEEGWRVVGPVLGPADDESVRDLLSSLSFLRATGFDDDPPGDAETGLDAPEFAVVLDLEPSGEGEEPGQRRLAIGREGPEGRWARAGAGPLFLIPAERLDDFPRDLSAYRFKELAKFGTGDASRIEMRFEEPDGASITIEGRRTEEGGSWSSQPEPMDPAKLSRLVTELASLEAAAIVAESAGPAELREMRLDPARVTLRVFGAPGDDGSEPLLAELRIGAQRGSDGILAARPDDPLVYQLDHALGEHLPVSLEAFRNRFLEQQMSVDPEADPEAPEAFEDID